MRNAELKEIRNPKHEIRKALSRGRGGNRQSAVGSGLLCGKDRFAQRTVSCCPDNYRDIEA